MTLYDYYRKSSIRSRDLYSRIFTDKKQAVGVRLIIKFLPQKKYIDRNKLSNSSSQILCHIENEKQIVLNAYRI